MCILQRLFPWSRAMMKTRRRLLVVLWHQLALGVFYGVNAAAQECALKPFVDNFIFSAALDTDVNPLFGWQLSEFCVGQQLGYRVMVSPAVAATVSTSGNNDSSPTLGHQNTLHPAWDSGWVESNASARVACAASLQPATQYSLVVVASFGTSSAATNFTSKAVTFVTAPSSAALVATTPMWHANASAQYVLFRGRFNGFLNGRAYLSVTAKPSPDWLLSHGNNSSKLLCAYKLWVNGIPMGVGPGRKVGGRISVDSYDLSSFVRDGRNDTVHIAVETFYQRAHSVFHGEALPDDAGGLLVVVHPTAGDDAFTRAAQSQFGKWVAFDATAAFNPQTGPTAFGAGTTYYSQPLEFIDGTLFPHFWRVPGKMYECLADGWSPVSPRAFFADGVQPRRAPPVLFMDVEAASFHMLELPLPGYHYVVDFGKEFQGHLNVTFLNGTAASGLTIRVGEQLDSVTGRVVFHALAGNIWEWNWTIAAGVNTLSPHEYVEFRFAEIIGAPEPPSKSLIRGWAVRYPLRPNAAASTTRTGGADPESSRPAFTAGVQLSSSDARLNAVWELCQYTLEAGTLDVNTDSNTRQRDVCTLDAFLQTVYQVRA
eukprot:INCI17172.1.p1 GENE.INCI17172.1~~INCI17172.1.p1  ORF type:complete len:598 (+),score=75.71 INCI17172.1:319-2112(+)